MNQSTETESLIGERRTATPPPPAPSENNQQQPAIVSSGYGSIQTPNVPPEQAYSYYADTRRNRPQSSSLGAASIIFLSNGMSLAMSIGFGSPLEFGTHAQYCWFIAIIIGACLSAVFANNVTKLVFNLIASLLVIIKGIIYISAPGSSSWIITARYCDGIAFGLVLIPTILAGSEQSVKQLRGRVLGVEQSSLVVGCGLMTAFTVNFTDVEINLIPGIISVIYGLLAVVFNFLTTIESPIFHLRKNNEPEALNVIRQLQVPGTITNETYALLNESKDLIEDDSSRNVAENISNGLIPLAKVGMLRVLVSLSLSLPITGNILLVNSNRFWFVFLRFIGITVSVMTIDRLGRKLTTAVAMLISSIFLLAYAALASSSPENILNNTMAAFLLIYQFLSGFVAPASTCYLSEAFSLSVKPYFILAVIVVENLIQVFISTQQSLYTSISNFAYILAALQFVFAFVTALTIPETRNTTLREALEKFKKIVYINFS